MRRVSNLIKTTMWVAIMALSTQVIGQTPISNWRPYDKDGINVFEPEKETDTEFEKLRVRIGGSFAQQYQSLDHENAADPNFFGETDIDLNQLFDIGPGFNLATANLYLDAQLADGIRVAVESYMSSRHHEEFWVKGGFIQIDKLPMWDNSSWFDDNLRVKIGHFQVNYGDQQFRRTDNGNAIYNPFVGNYIMDAFATEIGGEVYYFTDDRNLMFMVGATSGLIKGDVSAVGNTERNPSIYAKAAYDKQVNTDLRFRVSGSLYTNSESTRNTLYSGDRAGSRFYMVMEPAFAVPRGGNEPRPTGPGGRFTSGRFNPDFSKNITAIQINPFVKYKGLEFFGAYEMSSGYNSRENDEERSVDQISAELLYRFLKNEQVYVGARFMNLSGELRTDIEDASINRFEVAAGWFPIKNLLLKAEYVTQTYSDFPSSNLFHEGEFNGIIIEAIVGF